VQLRREDAERIALEGGEPACELVLRLFDQVADQGERLETLERRLGQNSVNSSLPPSSDRGQGPKRPVRKRSARKQGAQLGHEGASRKLIDDPDETLRVRPEQCRKCGHDLTREGRVVGRPARHQVIDLPESAVVTTEHQLLKVACPGCGTHTRAELPDGVERGAFGPRLRATVVMLAGRIARQRNVWSSLRAPVSFVVVPIIHRETYQQRRLESTLLRAIQRKLCAHRAPVAEARRRRQPRPDWIHPPTSLR